MNPKRQEFLGWENPAPLPECKAETGQPSNILKKAAANYIYTLRIIHTPVNWWLSRHFLHLRKYMIAASILSSFCTVLQSLWQLRRVILQRRDRHSFS
jgi:hypothetical protein